jgi:hypothetical protein
MRNHGLSLTLVGMASAAILVAGCSRPPGAGESPAPVGAAQPSQSIAASDCYVVRLQSEGPAAPTSDQVSSSSLIVVGTFKGYGPTKWNTADGTRPPQARLNRGGNSNATILRPLKVKVDTTLKGDAQKMARAYALGGQNGCDEMVFPTAPELVAGQRYLFFLWPVGDVDSDPKGDLAVGDAFAVAADGTLTRTTEAPIALDVLASQIVNGTVPTPEPPATAAPEPTDSGPG